MPKQNKRMRVVVQRRNTKQQQQSKSNKEISLLGRALRSLGSVAGGAAGSLIGAPVAGAAAGNGLGAAVSKWLGSGDYEVSRNSIVTRARTSPDIPMMHNNGQSVVVRHKDYLGPVLSSTTFNVVSTYPINPGRLETFPWLSNIARRFQEYSFKGIVFHYVPTSGSISSTQALGSVMIQTTYRATDSPPSSKTEMLNEYWAAEGAPYDTFCHPIECDPKENPFNVQYVRSADVPSTESKLMYDLGTTYVATAGQSTGGIVLGDLWVTYEVELKKPLITSDVTTSAIVAGRGWTGAALTSSNFFSGTLNYTDGSLPVTFAGRTIILPTGTFGMFYITMTLGSNAGFGGALDWSAGATLTNCTLATFNTNPTTGLQVTGSKSTSSTAELNMFYTIAVRKIDNQTTASIALPSATITSGVVDYIDIRIVNVESST